MDRDTAIGMGATMSRADTGTTITAITDQGNTRASTINPQQSPAPSVTFLRGDRTRMFSHVADSEDGRINTEPGVPVRPSPPLPSSLSTDCRIGRGSAWIASVILSSGKSVRSLAPNS
jgi:hypothetical protein